MARVYTKLLLAGSVSATEYTAVCPDGVLWVVRDAIFVWNGAADPAVETYNFDATDPLRVFDFNAGPLASGAHVVNHWQGRQVVEAGSTLEFASTTATWYITVTGYELTLP